MSERCEVCENFRPEGDLKPGRALVRRWFGNREVTLCRAHVAIAEGSDVRTLEDLRALYRESKGRRSFVPRRAREWSGVRKAGRRAADTVPR